MSFKVRMLAAAQQDVRIAAIWYSKQVKGLGSKFLNELKSYKKTLEKNPFFAKRNVVIRTLPLKKFPFMIHYTINEKQNEVIILSVLHTAQNPEIWPK